MTWYEITMTAYVGVVALFGGLCLLAGARADRPARHRAART